MKNKKRIIWILPLIIIAFFAYLIFGGNNADQITSEYALAQPIDELLDRSDSNMGEWAAMDDDGNIYYVENAGSGISSIIAQDLEGEDYHRWRSTESNEEVSWIEIAGIGENTLIFYFANEKGLSCEDHWNAEHVYYGIGLGTVSYSGAAGLLLEEDADLIEDLKSMCD